MSEGAPNQDYRLPTDVTPIHYDVKIWTDLHNLKFDGVVEVQLQVNKETSKIVLNSLDLDLGDVSLQSDGSQNAQQDASRDFDSANQRVLFTFPTALPSKSKARLNIAFKADLMGHMMGYYKSTGGKDGKTVYALTQFQPTAARRAFPCWDEPALKATFAITLASRKDTANISNMPAQSEGPFTAGKYEEGSWLARKFATLSEPSEWKITHFQTTPPMSTYIIAYANGPFEYLESSYKSPISSTVRPLRFYATADCIPHAQFALDTMVKVVPLYEQIFEVEYPLPKLDLFAASDFDLGGMENWGLIIGRTQCLLHDPASNDLHNQQYVASMVGHEVAHMWFGDITTMEWWDNLYLNEGFATLMGDKTILERIWPEWESDSEFLGSNFFRARALDAKLSSHPVEVECPDANKILQIFDALSYSKAASVLRMLSSYVGEERFLKGVSIYLKKHLYKNAVTKDLWEGIQAATDLDIPKVVDGWIKQMGYPVISVTEKQDGIQVRQDRFLETGPADPKDNENLWVVPLNILTVPDGKLVVHKELLEGRDKFISLDITKPFKLNAGTTGFYAVQYSAGRLAKLGKQAASPDSPFSLPDRIGVVWDAFALARAGYTPVSSALQLVDSLRSEEKYLVWDTVATNLANITSTWYENPRVVDLLGAFQKDLFVPLAKRLGFEYPQSSSPNERQLRTLAIDQATKAGDQSIMQQLKDWFIHYLKTGDDSKIPSELTGATFRIAVQEGGETEWEAVKRISTQPKNPAQGVAAMNALGASKDLALAEKTFQLVLTEARDQDVLYYVRGIQQNHKTRKLLAKLVKDNFDELEKRFAGTFNMTRLVQSAFQTLSSEKDYESTAAFFKDRDTSRFDLALKQSLDDIRTRAAWVKRSTDELVLWLEQRPKANP